MSSLLIEEDISISIIVHAGSWAAARGLLNPNLGSAVRVAAKTPQRRLRTLSVTEGACGCALFTHQRFKLRLLDRRITSRQGPQIPTTPQWIEQ